MIKEGYTRYFIFDFIVPIICVIFFSFVAYSVESFSILHIFLIAGCITIDFFCVLYFFFSFRNWEVVDGKLENVR
jgi:hypothetical protein